MSYGIKFLDCEGATGTFEDNQYRLISSTAVYDVNQLRSMNFSGSGQGYSINTNAYVNNTNGRTNRIVFIPVSEENVIGEALIETGVWYQLKNQFSVTTQAERMNRSLTFVPGANDDNRLTSNPNPEFATADYLWKFEEDPENPLNYAMICASAPEGFLEITPSPATGTAVYWVYNTDATAEKQYGFRIVSMADQMSETADGAPVFAITSKNSPSGYMLHLAGAGRQYTINQYNSDGNKGYLWAFAKPALPAPVASTGGVESTEGESYDLTGTNGITIVLTAPEGASLYYKFTETNARTVTDPSLYEGFTQADEIPYSYEAKKAGILQFYSEYYGHKSVLSSVNFSGTVTSLIDAISNIEGEQRIYDLQGRRVVAPAVKGLYIVNGKVTRL